MGRSKKVNNFFEGGVINEASMLAYLNNQLSADEKQQFEKLLKEDSFAQDALEGLQASQSEAAVATTLTSLHKKVRERTGQKEKKGFQLHWSNYAWAAVLLGLLIGIGFVMINFLGNHDSNIAMNKEETKAPENTNLFETKEELKPADIPVTVIKDSVHPSTVQPAETKAKETPLQSLKPADAATVTSATNADGKTKTDITKTNTGAVSVASEMTAKTKEPEKPAAAPAKAEQKNSVTVPTTQKVMRGGIIEREEADKVTAITMDDAMKNFNAQNYKQASEQFDAILQQQPANADALYFGGLSDYINGNARKSEKNFDKLLKDGTKFAEGSKWYKANILIQKGKKDEARKLLDELAQSNGSYKERAIKKKAEIVF